MTYSSQADVEFYGQFDTSDNISKGYDYTNSIMKAIENADSRIDEYCNVPEGFFNPGGITIQQEYHDGTEIGDYGLLVSFGLSIKRRPFLRFKHSPVLSVTSLEKSDSSGTWSALTEGRTNDYLVMETGVRFLKNVPSYDYKNVRVTYRAGYNTTPANVAQCSGLLASAILNQVLHAKDTENISIGNLSVTDKITVTLSSNVFTEELKSLVRHYHRKVPVKLL